MTFTELVFGPIDVIYPRKKNKVYPNLSYLIILPFNKYPLKNI